MRISRTLHRHCHDLKKHTEIYKWRSTNSITCEGAKGEQKKYSFQVCLKLIILPGVFGEPDRQLHLSNRIIGRVN